MSTIDIHAPLRPPSRNWNWAAHYLSDFRQGPSPLARLLQERYPGPFVRGLDLGAGTCCDSLFFLQVNMCWKMTAIDSEPAAVEFARTVKSRYDLRFDFKPMSFQDLRIAPGEFDLVFANLALQYYGQQGFENFIRMLSESVSLHGVFCANFLGKNHHTRKFDIDLAYVTREDIERMFQGFDLEIIENDYERDNTPQHRLHVFAKKL